MASWHDPMARRQVLLHFFSAQCAVLDDVISSWGRRGEGHEDRLQHGHLLEVGYIYIYILLYIIYHMYIYILCMYDIYYMYISSRFI